MLWIDLGLLGITAYRMVSSLRVAFRIMEKLALTFLFAMGLKSLVLFFLIQAEIRPFASIQVGVDVLMLIATLLLTRPSITLPESSVGTKWQTVLACLLIGILFLFGLANAWILPIMESDAAWYQVKALSFFHEIRFDSEWVVPQLRQYPPFIPLLFTWLITFDVEPLRILFPFFYLTLNLIFYSRILEFSGNAKMAAMFTLALGTTPYIWWHGVLPFLDLCTAVFYSAGALYWFFWMENLGVDEKKSRTMAFLSGLFFGLAAWTRLEFLLYALIPIVMSLCAESALNKDGTRDRKSFLIFFLMLLVFPTLWFFSLASFKSDLYVSVKMVGIVGVVAWLIALVFMVGNWRLKVSVVVKGVLLAGTAYIILIALDNSGPVMGWQKIFFSLYRTLIVHAFYLFTGFLAVFIFLGRLKNIPSINKLFALFLIFYPMVHFAIFSFSTPKWLTFVEYLSATFIHPGNSVNLSDTRAVMSMYPLLLFFIASIPAVRRGFDDD